MSVEEGDLFLFVLCWRGHLFALLAWRNRS